MKKLLLTLLIFHFSVIAANAQWVKQFTAPQYEGLEAIQFLNENTGYVVGGTLGSPQEYGSIYKTTNGGLNWVNQQLPNVWGGQLWALSFINVNTGYVCGYTREIFKTTNGGLNWTYFDLPIYHNAPNQNYEAIKFFNENTGYLGGRYGMMIKTTNGGENWISLDTAKNDIECLHFFDINTGLMEDYGTGIYKTTDGGNTWGYDSLNIYHVFEMDFIDYYTGFGAGYAVLKTTNGGISWVPISPSNITAYSFSLINYFTMYTGSYNHSYIYKTTNSGINWIQQQLPAQYTNGTVNSVFFVNTNTGYCCSGGEIFKTTNGGSVFINNISSEIPNEYKLFQNYPNPFNPSTNIKYEIIKTGLVTLKIFDILGKEITTLISEIQKPGTYEVPFIAENLNSGVYFYKIQSGNFTETKRMILIK